MDWTESKPEETHGKLGSLSNHEDEGDKIFQDVWFPLTHMGHH
jgi:hypothetical protein